MQVKNSLIIQKKVENKETLSIMERKKVKSSVTLRIEDKQKKKEKTKENLRFHRILNETEPGRTDRAKIFC